MSSMIKLHRSEHANPSWKIIFLQVLLLNNQQFNCFQQKGMQKSAFNICNTKVLYTPTCFFEKSTIIFLSWILASKVYTTSLKVTFKLYSTADNQHLLYSYTD